MNAFHLTPLIVTYFFTYVFGETNENILVWVQTEYTSTSIEWVHIPSDHTPPLRSESTYSFAGYKWNSLAVDFHTKTVTLSDAVNHWIYLTKDFKNPTGSLTVLGGGTSGRVEAITIDWFTQNVYWVDEGYNWIKMTSYSRGGEAIIIDTNIERPSGIACHPSEGYLFWTDLGNTYPPRIERSSLSGKNRVTIVTGVNQPRSIAVDITTSRIYWTEINSHTNENTIESADLNGNNKQTEVSFSLSEGILDSVTVDENFIYAGIVDDKGDSIRYYDKSAPNKDLVHSLQSEAGVRIFDISVVGRIIQEKPLNLPCDSHMCEHFCVSAADGKHECVCWNQYILKSDGTCSIDPGNVKPPVYIIAKSDSIALFDPLLLHYGVENKQQYIRDIISVAAFVTALTVDSHSRSLFYATSKIKAIRLENGTRSSALRENIGRVYGMAVDWISFNVYWADYDLHHIMVSTYDGQVTQELVSSDVVKPMSVAVDPNARLIFWSEVGLPGQIESSDLNGSNRRVLVDSTSASPTATTLDYKEQRVYFANDHNMDIQYVNYDGTELTKVYTSHHSVQGLTIFQDFIAMAETYSNFGLIEGFHKSSTELEGLIDINDSVYAIDIFDKSRQPIIDETTHYDVTQSVATATDLNLIKRKTSDGAVIGAVLGPVSCIIIVIIIIIVVYYYRRQNRKPLAEAYINDDYEHNNHIHLPDPNGRHQPQPGMHGHVYDSIREGPARIVAIDNAPGFPHNPMYGQFDVLPS